MTTKVLLLLCLVAFFERGYMSSRCRTDALYSYRVCNALTTFWKNRVQCDVKELNRLKQRVSFLQGVLNALMRESNAMRNRETQPSNCQGVEYENACYFLLDQGGSDSMKSYSEAESACHIKQARLATMDNQPMYDVLYDYVKKNAQDFVNKARSLVLIWTGASYTDGQIILRNNKTSNFSMWSSYHPLNTTERNKIAVAVATNPDVSGMFDAMPSLKLYPLCKKNLNSNGKSS